MREVKMGLDGAHLLYEYRKQFLSGPEYTKLGYEFINHNNNFQTKGKR